MTAFSDIVDDILVEAGKQGEPSRKMVERTVKDVMSEINDRLSSLVFKSRKTVTVAASANLVDMPAGCKTIIAIGEYDATSARIKFRWYEMSEEEYHNDYEGSAVISPTSDQGRWYVVQDFSGSKGQMRIRPVPAPTTSITVLVIFYGKLTQSNMGRISGHLIKDGVKSKLGRWFVQTFQAHKNDYYRGMADLKRKHGTVNSPIKRRQAAHVRRANRTARGLV